jgi:hypothetical protein
MGHPNGPDEALKNAASLAEKYRKQKVIIDEFVKSNPNRHPGEGRGP